MAFTVVNNGDGTGTATWAITSASAKIFNMSEDAGQYIYPVRWQLFDASDPPEPRAWGDLSNAEKLTVMDQEYKFMSKEMAKSFYVNDARDTAAASAKTEADDRYDI